VLFCEDVRFGLSAEGRREAEGVGEKGAEEDLCAYEG